MPPPLRYRRRYEWDADDHLVGIGVENVRQNDGGTHVLQVDNLFIDSRFEYDLLGRRVTETREVSGGEVGPARSVTTGYRHDAAGRRVRVIRSVDGADETWRYDERGLLIAHTRGADSESPATVEWFHDAGGEVVLEVAADDSDGDGEREVTEHRYDGHRRRIATIDAAGGVRTFERDERGRVVAESVLGSSGGPTPWDGSGNVLLARSAHRHDALGRMREVRRMLFGAGDGGEPRALVERTDRDGEGRVSMRRLADGREVTYERDAAGRVVVERDTAGTSVALRLDANGNVLRRTRSTVSEEIVDPTVTDDPDYDDAGRLVRVERDVYAWDALDRLIVHVDNAGGTWRRRYDSRGHTVLWSDSTASAIGAAAEPDLAAVMDLLSDRQRSNVNGHGNRVRSVYDNLGRAVEVTHELRRDGTGDSSIETTNAFNLDGLITETFEWDDADRLVAWQNDNRRRTVLEWDPLGVPRRKTWPDGVAATWDCDRNGRPVRSVGRDGTVVTQEFDALGRVTTRTAEPPEGSDLVAVAQSFEYDGLSRVTFSVDTAHDGTDRIVDRRYDSLGRLVEEWQGPYRFVLSYDDAGRMVERRYPDGSRYVVERGVGGGALALIDESGIVLAEHLRLRRVLGGVSRAGSDDLLERRVLGGTTESSLELDVDGILRDAGHDALGRATRRVWTNDAGELVLGYDWGLDERGRRLWERELHRSGHGTAWRYDSVYDNRLYLPDLFDPRVVPADPLSFREYYRDGARNWRQVNIDFRRTFWEVDTIDRFTAAGDRTPRHDERGNTTAFDGDRYTFDALDRLVKVERRGRVVAHYRYDAFGAENPWRFNARGRRVVGDVLEPAPGQRAGIAHALWIGTSPAEERAEDGTLLRRWVDGEDDEIELLLDRGEGGALERLFVIADREGSTVGVATDRGEIAMTVRYGPRGEPTFLLRDTPRVTPPVEVGMLWRGDPFDRESGLRRFGARHYHPALGRFLTPCADILPRGAGDLNDYISPSAFPTSPSRGKEVVR